MKKCKICNNKIVGRSDKLFCSVKCKNYYHINLRKTNEEAVKLIDSILHRNRTILLEILGKKRLSIKVDRILLIKKKFQFDYHTHLRINKQNKTYYYLYDFAWMSFSTDEILIIRK